MSDDEAQARLDNYLGHMLEAAQLAVQYVRGLSKDEFLTDRRTQQAVVLNLMTIGEAASRIVNEVKSLRWRILRSRGLRCAVCATAWFTVTST
jgi:uncharacterized protein with HEPN domain